MTNNPTYLQAQAQAQVLVLALVLRLVLALVLAQGPSQGPPLLPLLPPLLHLYNMQRVAGGQEGRAVRALLEAGGVETCGPGEDAR